MKHKKRPKDEQPAAQVRVEGEAADETPVADTPAGDAMADLARERDDLLARLQRVSADYMNYQKRVQRDMEAARTFANEEIIKALLGVLDDMERALAAGRKSHDVDDPFVIGMQLVHDKALETLGKFGLVAIEAEGKPFNPELHSAMMQQPNADHPPQTVLTEVVRGYQLKGRTIRPSGVVVSKVPEPAKDPEPPDNPSGRPRE